MKTYEYKTDAESGEIEAESLEAAYGIMLYDAHLTDKAVADGGWGWVEDPETLERKSIGVIP